MKHDWEYKKLGDYITEYNVKNKEDKPIPVYSVTNSQGFCKEYFNKEVASKDKTTYKIVPYGFFAYNPSRINVGSIDWQHIEDYVIVSPLYNVFSVKKEIRQDYLLYFIKSFNTMAYINILATGTVRSNLKLSMLKEFSIPVPPLPIQQQIVAELDKVSEIIEKKKQQVKELDNLAQSIFYDMFGDPVENEKGWEVCRINEVASLKNGLNYDKVDKGVEVKILGVGDFKNNKIITSGEIGYTTVSNKVAKEFLLKDNDVVFVRSNGSKALIGRCVLVETQGELLSYSGFCIRCRLLSNGIEPRYFLSFMQTPLIKERLTGGGRGCSIQNINQSSLGNQVITLPPLPLQQSFAQKIEAIEKQKELINQSIKEAQLLFDSRMDYWFGM